MSGNAEEDTLAPIRARVKEQGDLVRKLKAEGADELTLKRAVNELKLRKKELDDREAQLNPLAGFDRHKLDDLIKQRFFFDQSFAIYGGVQGLFDYGPTGCAVKTNMLALWRQMFVIEEQLLEVDCTMLTPEPVLQASGHVDRFTDYMVRDTVTGECFRADHLVEAALEQKQKNKKTSEEEKRELDRLLAQLDNLDAKGLQGLITKYDIRSPSTGNTVTEPQTFNLMFSTHIGPTGGASKGYLRPETAQGIFVNFPRLLQCNQGRLPFGVAQVGPAFRNEISPRSGLIRVREFTMAEIEYFVDPAEKSHFAKWDLIRTNRVRLYSQSDQMEGRSPREISLEEAVQSGVVANQTLAYFLARIHAFLLRVGVDPSRLRFRQHLANEMAHYACDCWDAECLTSHGWVECVGCADRSCFDLQQHARATGTRMVAERLLPEPRQEAFLRCLPDKGELGRRFKADAKALTAYLAELSIDSTREFKTRLEAAGQAEVKLADGRQFNIPLETVKFQEGQQTVHVEEIVPNVIEPSFGIGRIIYTVLEHQFSIREGDEQRTYLRLPACVAPYKCSLLPLSGRAEFQPFLRQLSADLARLGVQHQVDASAGSIGRRYARTDQIGIPFGVTVDFDTVNREPHTVTLRERDSMRQLRVPVEEVASLVHRLSEAQLTWTEAAKLHPEFVQQETA